MDKTKRYVFVIRSLTGGGAERVVSVLASHMAEEGFDVSIIAYGKTAQDYSISEKVRRFYMPERSEKLTGKICRIWDMWRFLREIQPDVILPFVGTVVFVAYLASLGLRIPFVRTIRVSPWVEEGQGFRKYFRKYLNEKAAAIMVQNEEQRAYFPERLQHKIYVVPNPVSDVILEKKKTAYASQVRNFVTVGRLEWQKNQEMMIRTYAKLVKTYPDLTLSLYGRGQGEEQLRTLAQELGVEKGCHFEGRRENIEEILTEADAFLLTSRYEGMPNALMEAMAVGLPCLSSDCKTGPKTLIKNGVNGLLYQEGNQEELKEKWEWMINHPAELSLMGREAGTTIREGYTYEAVCQQFLKMLADIKKRR